MKNGVNRYAERPENPLAFPNGEADFPDQALKAADPPAEDCVVQPVTKDVLSEISLSIFSRFAKIRKALERQREDHAEIRSLTRQTREQRGELLALRDRNQSLLEASHRAEELEAREKRLKEQVECISGELREATQDLAESKRALEATQSELKQAGKREASLSEDLKKQSLMLEETTEALFERDANLGKAVGVLQKVESIMAEILPSDTQGEEGSPVAVAEQFAEASPADDSVSETDVVTPNGTDAPDNEPSSEDEAEQTRPGVLNDA